MLHYFRQYLLYYYTVLGPLKKALTKMGTKNIFITVTASVNYYLCQCLHLRYSYQTV